MVDINTLWNFTTLSIISAALVATLTALFSKDHKFVVGVRDIIIILSFFSITIIVFVIAIIVKSFTISIDISKYEINNNALTDFIFIIGAIIFILGWIGLMLVFLRIYCRIYHLREAKCFKYIFPIKYFTLKKQGLKKYELEQINRKPDNTLANIPLEFTQRQREIIAEGCSVLLKCDAHITKSDIVLDIVMESLQNLKTANYVCCDKHPFEVWKLFRQKYETLARKKARDLVFIDAYTKNYGFDDDILTQNLIKLEAEGLAVIQCKTMAGIHSATAKAFNIIKDREKEEGKKVRRPNRMIWDNLSNLVDVSSVEQIKLFINHVIPAEKAYGMISIFIEYNESNNDILITLERLVDIIITITEENDQRKIILSKFRDNPETTTSNH